MTDKTSMWSMVRKPLGWMLMTALVLSWALPLWMLALVTPDDGPGVAVLLISYAITTPLLGQMFYTLLISDEPVFLADI